MEIRHLWRLTVTFFWRLQNKSQVYLALFLFSANLVVFRLSSNVIKRTLLINLAAGLARGNSSRSFIGGTVGNSTSGIVSIRLVNLCL